MTASPRLLGFPDRLADGRMPRAVIFGELHPPADIGGLPALTAARLVVDAVGAIVRLV
jgi:hypothetical protein